MLTAVPPWDTTTWLKHHSIWQLCFVMPTLPLRSQRRGHRRWAQTQERNTPGKTCAVFQFKLSLSGLFTGFHSKGFYHNTVDLESEIWLNLTWQNAFTWFLYWTGLSRDIIWFGDMIDPGRCFNPCKVHSGYEGKMPRRTWRQCRLQFLEAQEQTFTQFHNYI